MRNCFFPDNNFSQWAKKELLVGLQHQSISLPPQVVKNEEVNSMNNAVIPSLPEVALPNTISISPQEMIHTNGDNNKSPMVMQVGTPKYEVGTNGENVMMKSMSISPPDITTAQKEELSYTNEGNLIVKKPTMPASTVIMPPGMPHMHFPNMGNPFAFHMMQPQMVMEQPTLPSRIQGTKLVLFDCSYPDCPERFFKSRKLYEHLRNKHKTDFKCPHCKKQNACMANFVSHVRIHTNEKPWICPVDSCKYRGRTKNHAKCHVIQNHGIQTLEIFDCFFMQDRTENSINLKRKLPMSIPRSLLKRTKFNPSTQHLPMPNMSLPPMGIPMFGMNPPIMGGRPLKSMQQMSKLSFLPMKTIKPKLPEEVIQDLLNFNGAK